MRGQTVRYSEAFKLKVIQELEEGKFDCAYDVAQCYGIGCPKTVAHWAKQYGKNHLLKKFVRVETEEDIAENKRLKDRIKKLETALADAVMDNALNESFLEILCERTNVEVDAFKKKHAAKASTGHARRRKEPKE